jgi:hypothetical protein
MMKLKLIAALVLFSLAPAWATIPEPLPPYVGGTNSTCGVESFLDTGAGEARYFIGIAFALVSFAIGLAYMYSKFRQDPAMGIWAKDEAFNLIISILLFAGVLVFFTASCELASSYASGNPISVSSQYLDTLISANGLNMLRSLTYDSLNNQLDATRYVYRGLTPFWGDGVAMRANRKAFSAHKEFLINMYLPILASLNAQKYVIQGISWMGAYVLLPFAFVMRLIPPTRDFGNMLIALFFGLYIVVPTTYAMSGQIFFTNVVNNPPYHVTSLEKFYSFGLDNVHPGGNIDDPRGAVLYRIGSTLPQAIFLPNLAIILGVTSTMAISKALRALAV